jgi:hypothetical protein
MNFALFPKSISVFEKWTKKMSKNENPKYFLEKICKNHFVTIMLSFPFSDENICDDKILNIFGKNHLNKNVHQY